MNAFRTEIPTEIIKCKFLRVTFACDKQIEHNSAMFMNKLFVTLLNHCNTRVAMLLQTTLQKTTT